MTMHLAKLLNMFLGIFNWGEIQQIRVQPYLPLSLHQEMASQREGLPHL